MTSKMMVFGMQRVVDLAKSKWDIARYIALLFLFATVFSVLVPFAPSMPMGDLESSWIFGINQAVAQGLRFGKDIIFTFGPYASIYTQSYHPATYRLMMLGAIDLSLAYFVVLSTLSRGVSLRWVIAYGVVLAASPFSPDAIFFSYPLLAAFFVYRLVLPEEDKRRLAVSWRICFELIFVFFTLGMLPLIKESILFACLPVILLSFLFLLHHGKRFLAMLCGVSPIAGLIFYWCSSGQDIVDMPSFFLNATAIAGGYTDAMSMDGRVTDVIFYIIGAAAVVIAAASLPKSMVRRIYMFAIASIFLFLSFKAGFVRHDAHAIRSGVALLLISFALPFVSDRRYVFVIPVVATICCWFVCMPYVQLTVGSVGWRAVNTYKNAYRGIVDGIAHPKSLTNQFDARLRSLALEGGIPKAEGSADIYPTDLSYLISSGNQWLPRPIIQSYSAFTKRGAQLNYEHLLSDGAPKNIFFKVAPIDGRMPAMEDGLSWLALLRSYSPSEFVNGYLVLEKSEKSASVEMPEEVIHGSYRLGNSIVLPNQGDGLLYITLTIRKTLFGRIVSTLYKPPVLELELTMNNGEKRRYRIVSEMAESGFIVSPLIVSARDFALLYGSPELLQSNSVRAISVEAEDDRLHVWADSYSVRVDLIAHRQHTDISHVVKFDYPIANKTYAANMDVGQCQGNIDVIDGERGEAFSGLLGGIFEARGWLVLSVQKAAVPDQIFFTFSDSAGGVRFIPAHRTKRPDVKEYFHQPMLSADVGFDLYADISSIPRGKQTLGLAYLKSGKIYACPQFKMSASK